MKLSWCQHWRCGLDVVCWAGGRWAEWRTLHGAWGLHPSPLLHNIVLWSSLHPFERRINCPLLPTPNSSTVMTVARRSKRGGGGYSRLLRSGGREVKLLSTWQKGNHRRECRVSSTVGMMLLCRVHHNVVLYFLFFGISCWLLFHITVTRGIYLSVVNGLSLVRLPESLLIPGCVPWTCPS